MFRLAVGEIFVSVTGLEFAYACAPDRVKALIMSLFLLTTAVGNMFSGVLYSTVFANMAYGFASPETWWRRCSSSFGVQVPHI